MTKPKKQRKPRVDVADVEMTDVAQTKPKPIPRPKRAKKSSPKAPKTRESVARATKFKEQQHLKIETQDLGEPDAEKQAPPSSTSKKRRRRSAAEIDRKFVCPFPDCTKAYGSEGSLTHHQKLKHPEPKAEVAKEKETQVGAFLLPLHRNVTIRPATPLLTFTSDPSFLANNQSTNDFTETATPSDIIPPSAKAARRNLRSRSNSEPVALNEEVAPPAVPIPTPLSNPTKTKTPRKPRRASTPHPKKIASVARRTKLRSKSESLPEITPFQPLDELKMPANQRSDSTASAHAAILPITNISSGGRGSFEWPPSSFSASASGHDLSSDDQAIDSDILSVLATCDTEDIGSPTLLDFGAGPSSTSSFQSNTSFGESDNTETLPVGMECFKIAEHATLPTENSRSFVMNEPEAELGLNAFATLGDDWVNALHLSSHLEKMSMEQADSPPHSLQSAFGAVPTSEGIVGRLRSASDPVQVATPMHPELSHFSSMPLESFPFQTDMADMTGNQVSHELTNDSDLVANNQVSHQLSNSNDLVAHQLQRNANFQQWFGGSSAKVEDKNNIQEMFWLPSDAGVATMGNPQPTSEVLDELLQDDDTLEWKATNGFEGDANTGADGDYALIGDTEMPPTLL